MRHGGVCLVFAALATTATACTDDSAVPTKARGRIAFLATMGDDRATELRVVDVQDGGTRLAVAADSTNAPHWSPDGSRLVFVGRLESRVGLMLARTKWAAFPEWSP
jgi:dipeptidyl aminopeptidase/acylaminoacyl peptidase